MTVDNLLHTVVGILIAALFGAIGYGLGRFLSPIVALSVVAALGATAFLCGRELGQAEEKNVRDGKSRFAGIVARVHHSEYAVSGVIVVLLAVGAAALLVWA